MTATILTGDCLRLLGTIAEGSVQTCVTSPPYFGLRDYDVPPSRWPRINYAPMPGMRNVRVPAMECALGLEPTAEAFVAHLVHVFRLVHRTLRDDGTLWLNLGDSYAGTGGRGPQTGALFKGRARQRETITTAARIRGKGLKEKDMAGIPWRVAFALQADGWFLRQDIIWSKPNPMPESVRDRCTKAHEYLFLLSKSERYYFDDKAIAEDAVDPRGPGNVNPVRALPGERESGENANLRGSLHKIGVREKRNRRSVWTVPVSPFKEAHFATFPPKLIEPCILAGAPGGGIVLDPFVGSGTTGKVSEALGRDSILIELNPKFADMTDRRTRQRGMALEGAAA